MTAMTANPRGSQREECGRVVARESANAATRASNPHAVALAQAVSCYEESSNSSVRHALPYSAA